MNENASNVGRPSDYSDDIAERMCLRISEGETLSAVCSDPAMPARTTAYQWMDKEASFAHRYARARERQADAHADEILSASTLPDDCTSQQINAARLRVDALKWTAAKLRPSAYGDKLLQTLTDVKGEELAFTVIFVQPPLIDVTPTGSGGDESR